MEGAVSDAVFVLVKMLRCRDIKTGGVVLWTHISVITLRLATLYRKVLSGADALFLVSMCVCVCVCMPIYIVLV